MKKIMFNDNFWLTQAVLDGRKTMTRRTITLPNNYVLFSSANKKNGKLLLSFLNDLHELVYIESQYQVGEVVAIAQRYRDFIIGNDLDEKFAKLCCDHYMPFECLPHEAGANNKMFVKADLMPHHIRIINVRVERLRDISDEDCLREGIIDNNDIVQYQVLNNCFFSPREAFAYLLDKVSGKGTWERNPYVFVYEFELVD